MTAYAFWNNKGGVGKSFLCFISAAEYAHQNPDVDVFVLDLCPQANVSETLLGGFDSAPEIYTKLLQREPRCSVAGYLEARLSSPFRRIDDVEPYVVNVREFNPRVAPNLHLVPGDNLLEIIAEAIRQTSQLPIPVNSWRQVILWLQDLMTSLEDLSDKDDVLFAIDCNPSFSIYTQLALAAADHIVVPFTADDSSRRAVENVVALLYGLGDENVSAYSRINFSKLAKEEGVDLPRLHSFVSNRVTFYEGKPSRAFAAAAKKIKETVDSIYKRRRSVFSDRGRPSEAFIDVPDYHSACIVSAMTGTPLHALRAGPRNIAGERVQINPDPLLRYRDALQEFVDRL